MTLFDIFLCFYVESSPISRLDITDKLNQIAEFYCDSKNWDSFNAVHALSESFSQSSNGSVLDIIEKVNFDVMNQLTGCT